MNPGEGITWDTNTAMAAILVGSLAVLWAVRAGVRGIVIA